MDINNTSRISFSLRGRDSSVLRAFVREVTLCETDVSNGFIMNQGYPYEIIFDDLSDGIIIMENLPMKVLISFQTLTGGRAVAVVRIIRSKNHY